MIQDIIASCFRFYLKNVKKKHRLKMKLFFIRRINRQKVLLMNGEKTAYPMETPYNNLSKSFRYPLTNCVSRCACSSRGN